MPFDFPVDFFFLEKAPQFQKHWDRRYDPPPLPYPPPHGWIAMIETGVEGAVACPWVSQVKHILINKSKNSELLIVPKELHEVLAVLHAS